MESILTSIKKLLGIQEECEDFDTDIIIHINTVFTILNQLDVGPEKGFRIKDDTTTWEEYIKDDLLLESVKDYIYLKVKLIFDPPSSSAVIESINRTLSELEWRLSVTVDSKTTENQNGNDGGGI